MEPGRMNKRLTFQRKSTTPNSFGEEVNWIDYYTCWGSVQQLRSQLIYGSGEFVGKETYDVRIRHTTSQAITIGDIFSTENTVFQIDGLMNVKMLNREIQILAHVINQTS